MNLFAYLSFFKALIAPKREEAPGIDRAIERESNFDGISSDPTEQNKGLEYYWAMGMEPTIEAGKLHRDISRLWVSAKGLEANEQGAYFPAQILPYKDESLHNQVWEYICWLLDERLERSMTQILKQIQLSYIDFGRSVQELMWGEKPEFTKWGKKTVLYDMRDRDPDEFIFNPPNLPPGVYRKKSIYNTSDLERMSDRKFAIFTNLYRFENLYGRSELSGLVSAEKGLRNVYRFWERAIETDASPQKVHYYPKELEGGQHQDWRNNQLANLAKAGHQAWIQISERSKIEALNVQGDLESAAKYVQARKQEISLRLTGSATSLEEGKYGSYSREESAGTRRKSEKEQYDCDIIQESFNFQVIPWACEWNWLGLEGFPRLQIIEPERINPTTPEGQPDQGKEDEDREEIEVRGKKEKPEKSDKEGEDMKAKKFAEDPKKEEGEEEDRDKTLTGFPNRNEPPPLYKDKKVVVNAFDFMGSQDVLLRKDFDQLSDAEKRKAFTISAIKDLPTLKKLHGALRETVAMANEKDAWGLYYDEAKKIMKGAGIKNVADYELMLSFRMGRQNAINRGIFAKAQQLASEGKLHGIQYHSLDDAHVRIPHGHMDDKVFPADSAIWNTWTPPVGFGCRCWIEPILISQHLKNPEKYRYSDPPTLEPEEGFK